MGGKPRSRLLARQRSFTRYLNNLQTRPNKRTRMRLTVLLVLEYIVSSTGRRQAVYSHLKMRGWLWQDEMLLHLIGITKLALYVTFSLTVQASTHPSPLHPSIATSPTVPSTLLLAPWQDSWIFRVGRLPNVWRNRWENAAEMMRKFNSCLAGIEVIQGWQCLLCLSPDHPLWVVTGNEPACLKLFCHYIKEILLELGE